MQLKFKSALTSTNAAKTQVACAAPFLSSAVPI